ncbi:MAG: OB-fold domain-containing protein [Novosphingobium sp.]|nr:OB-fold domain-containing protein [Novosphingobium sp.]MCP5401269.1 OB-fold domain-containing protein [Novosphingobium sp.]
MSGEAASPPERKLPALTRETEAFWTGGKDGQLLIQRCSQCGTYQHPPLPMCSTCRTETVAPAQVSGKGRVKTYTVNHQAWLPGLTEPFAIAAIELDEQPELYVFSNILAQPDAVRSGMRVKVSFENHEDVWLPMFVPDGETPQ